MGEHLYLNSNLALRFNFECLAFVTVSSLVKVEKGPLSIERVTGVLCNRAREQARLELTL